MFEAAIERLTLDGSFLRLKVWEKGSREGFRTWKLERIYRYMAIENYSVGSVLGYEQINWQTKIKARQRRAAA